MAESEWKPWVERYLAAIPPDEAVAGMPAKGPIADGKAAIALARELWTATFGADATLNQAPYRSYRKGNRWVVLGQGGSGRLGEGYVLVVEHDSGRVIRLRDEGAAKE